MGTKRHSTATFDTLRNFNRICLDKSIGSEAVDINKLMPLSLVSYLQSRPPGLWIIPSSASQFGVGFYQSRPPGLLTIPSSASQLGVGFYQSRPPKLWIIFCSLKIAILIYQSCHITNALDILPAPLLSPLMTGGSLRCGRGCSGGGRSIPSSAV